MERSQTARALRAVRDARHLPAMEPLLEVNDLRTTFATPQGDAHAVDGVSFTLARGEFVALVGESGSGKSVLAASLMGLIPPPGRITQGSVRFEGRDLAALDRESFRALRGRRMAMIVQEPAGAFDPRQRIGEQVAEIARAHGERSVRGADARVAAALSRAGLDDPARVARSYPHQLSGGMRQRVLIAMALLLEPALILADEPTTALDATVRRGILDALMAVRRETGTTILLITHDLGVVEATCERAMVMYAGRLVESGPVAPLFARASHPYTQGLLASVPRLGEGRRPFTAIPGMVPAATARPSGCTFRDRCGVAFERCAHEVPSLVPTPIGGAARCHLIGSDSR
jgi:peptide/nickel transport system ATP-binding protein